MINWNKPEKMTMITGIVIEINETNYSCKVKPHKDYIPDLENVPLRVFNLDDDFGVIIVPEEDTDCLIGFIEGVSELPKILQVQKWKKIIIKRKDVFESVIDQDGNVSLATEGNVNMKVEGNVEGIVQGNILLKVQGIIQLGPQGQHKAAWGDAWLQAFNAHIHPTPNGPSGPPNPPLQDPNVNSQKVTLD